MKRRDFIKTSVLAGAVMGLSLDGFAADKPTDLVAIQGGEPEVMLQRALKELGGIEKYVKKGQTVVVKPNIGWDRTPELAANTNPKLVAALVKECKKAGAKKVIVFDHTCDNWKMCYEKSGIADAVKKAGGEMLPGNEEVYYKDVNLPDGVQLKSTKIHEALLNADVWFNVPVLKNHGGAKMTCAMKNYMGIVWDRRFFHSNDLQQCIADVCTWNKKPVLNIVDAYRIMRKNGPQGKSEADVSVLKTLIASSNIVAVDTAALKFFNQVETLDLSDVGHIEKGEALKLGTTDLDKLTIKRIKI